MHEGFYEEVGYQDVSEDSPTRSLAVNGLPCFKEDEDLWPANPWQAQADAHLRQLQRCSLPQDVPGVPGVPGVVLSAAAAAALLGLQGPGGDRPCGPCGCTPLPTLPVRQGYPAPVSTAEEGLAQRVRELEGQLAAMEEKSAAQERQLQEAEARLCGLQQRSAASSSSGGVNEVEALQRKSDFLSVLVSRFERKTMALEEEIAGLTVALEEKSKPSTLAASSAAASSQTEAFEEEDSRTVELEGQLALLEESLSGKERELGEMKERLAEEQQLRATVKGRTPQELAAEVEALQSRAGFLSELVTRFEDKTMVLEGQVKSLTTSEQDAREQLQQRDEALSEAKEDAASAALSLRDAKKEHNRRVQELLRQVQQLEARGRRDLEAKAQEDQKELKELKELNAQMLQRLTRERSEHAETKTRLKEASGERENLASRIGILTEQLFELSEQNDSLEEKLRARQ